MAWFSFLLSRNYIVGSVTVRGDTDCCQRNHSGPFWQAPCLLIVLSLSKHASPGQHDILLSKGASPVGVASDESTRPKAVTAYLFADVNFGPVA